MSFWSASATAYHQPPSWLKHQCQVPHFRKLANGFLVGMDYDTCTCNYYKTWISFRMRTACDLDGMKKWEFRTVYCCTHWRPSPTIDLRVKCVMFWLQQMHSMHQSVITFSLRYCSFSYWSILHSWGALHMCVLTVARFYFLKCCDSILGNMIRWFKVTCGICKLFPVVSQECY